MEEYSGVIRGIFKAQGMPIPAEREALFDTFMQAPRNKALIDVIMQTGNMLMDGWKREEKIRQMVQQPVRIPNATVSKPYTAQLDFNQLGWNGITHSHFTGLEPLGLAYDATNGGISGMPTQSGDHNIVFHFKLEGQPEEAPFNEKPFTLTINPDPKSLWKTLESDPSDPYWKEDNITRFAPLGDRHILVSSKRGRSHANVGSFREDDVAFASLEGDWQVVVVSDGAGSARLSRKGSAIACASVVDFFSQHERQAELAALEALALQHQQQPDSEKALNKAVYNCLGKAAFNTHKSLEAFAAENGATLKDLSATLIFTLWKKVAAGYIFFSFGVGDCPIAILNKDINEVTLMNWLDVGEFGGGTRFITMPEIFQNEKFATRFGFKMMDDFSYLIMMSDGIYDPKFVVEAALPKVEKWQEFLADLNGANNEGAAVQLAMDNPDIEEQFSKWMDFWSPGNHDDRTLAIVF